MTRGGRGKMVSLSL
uniref:Uncharacterized protein n=1 Tax=Rhizophora mucronata TaxID=61149 RepID=A0A2P2QPC9_RHIMU